MERVVVHIGSHKTGSSAIQGALLESADALLARGILYPRTGRGHPGLNPLAKAIQESGAPTGTASHRQLLDEVKETGASVLVLSAEGFLRDPSPRTAEWARSLDRVLLPRLGTQVIAYVRPQWELIESGYTQRVKNGVTRMPFADYFESMIGAGELRYPRRFGRWRAVFGDLDIWPYRREDLVEGDVVADFWRVAGLGSAPGHSDRYANRRPGARTTEMLRLVSLALAEDGLDQDLRIIRPALRAALKQIESELPADEAFAPLTSEQIAQVADQLASSNEEFVRDFLGGRHASLFTPPVERRQAMWFADDASGPELAVLRAARERALEEARAVSSRRRRREARLSAQ